MITSTNFITHVCVHTKHMHQAYTGFIANTYIEFCWRVSIDQNKTLLETVSTSSSCCVLRMFGNVIGENKRSALSPST